ncbi:hypothetical protein TGRH88_083720 [Toxoplasma gondii]|uniref:Uncharacterized protein n=1 Tax=Toxoplasma gondii TaxID=5811 RepID=A0A7J6KHD1_TOXGO|nr:hypothetical protein TGRH88_083720 [Toxoplasma gondii]
MTTEGGVCRMAEATYIGRRQEAVCPQAEIAVLVGEDQESTILVADERYVITKDILSCPNAYEECHVVVQCVFEEPPVGLRFQEWEVEIVGGSTLRSRRFQHFTIHFPF